MIIFADDVAQEVREAKLIDLSGEPLPRQQYDTSRWVSVSFIIVYNYIYCFTLLLFIPNVLEIDVVVISIEKLTIYYNLLWYIIFYPN